MFDKPTLDAIRAIAARLDVEAAALAAVIEVESAGKAFALVDGRQEPVIRFEGHYFYNRLTIVSQRSRAVADGLASPTPQKIKNPSSQADRWKLLNRAIAINANAALESCSWGVGQVMGSHWKDLGFSSVSDLVNLCRRDVAGQIEVMVRFMERNGLVSPLQRRDWHGFARIYNGTNYAAGSYHANLRDAYKVWAAKLAEPAVSGIVVPTPPVLKLGSGGADVQWLQGILLSAGYLVELSGTFDETTDIAVRLYQRDRSLVVDGKVGPQTRAALEREPPRRLPADPPPDQTDEERTIDGFLGVLFSWVAKLFGRA